MQTICIMRKNSPINMLTLMKILSQRNARATLHRDKI